MYEVPFAGQSPLSFKLLGKRHPKYTQATDESCAKRGTLLKQATQQHALTQHIRLPRKKDVATLHMERFYLCSTVLPGKR